MDAGQLIDRLGGTFAVARMLRIRPPSVSGWRKAGVIPDDKLARLAPQAELQGIATRQQLMPEVWREIWPELVAMDDAQQAPADAHA